MHLARVHGLRDFSGMKRVGHLVFAFAIAACGSSVLQHPDSGTPMGQDGAPTGACSSLGECACFAANDRCSMRTEACWCPSTCDPAIVCVCGGGQFLSCEEKRATGACGAEIARVTSLCAGKPFVQYLGEEQCSVNADCAAACFATNIVNVDTCAQIDCYFCPVCDCLPPPPSPLRDCLAACRTPVQ
jgi:hypothetical protein